MPLKPFCFLMAFKIVLCNTDLISESAGEIIKSNH